MTLSIKIIFLACALICFFLKGISLPAGRIDFFAFGFFFTLLWIAS